MLCRRPRRPNQRRIPRPKRRRRPKVSRAGRFRGAFRRCMRLRSARARPPRSETDFSALPGVPDGVFTAPLRRPSHVGEDWLEPAQRGYSSEEDAIWRDLFERQMNILPGRACEAFFAGLQKLHLDRDKVPEFARLSAELQALTGWSVVPVPM